MPRTRRRPGLVLALMLLAPFAVASGWGADLAIGLGARVTSIDPHFHNTSPNNGVAVQIFDRLVHQDGQQRLIPGLATVWRALDETTWEFELRRDVRFHDGAPFDAEDVVASFRRAPEVPNSPSSFATYTRAIRSIEVVEPHRVRFRTAGPYPLLPADVSAINIISRRHAGATTADFNAGRAAIGTGPFRFQAWVAGEQLVVARNPGWWGGAVAWDKVTFRLLVSDQTRVAALLSGEVQVIEIVPTADVRRLERDPQIALHRAVSNRVLYLHLDTARARTPYVTGRAGQTIDNPLRDLRVRRALSLAINRQAIVERMQEGLAIPAGGVIPEGFFGGDATLRADPFDPDQARRLLAEAGLPDGFALTLHAPNDRYVNDDQVAQAIGAMFARVGVLTRVETMPWAVYAARTTRLDFSLGFFGWGAATGEASSPLRALLATFDNERGMGASNRGRYSSRQFDATLDRALATIDDGAREALLREATRTAIADQAIIPLYFQVNVWATRRGLAYAPRADDQTWAIDVRPGP